MSEINKIQDTIYTAISTADTTPAIEILTDRELEENTVTSISKVGILRKIIYGVSLAIDLLKKSFAIHKVDIEQRRVDTEKFQTPWFIGKALAYQHGQALQPDKTYNNNGLTTEEIAARKVIGKAALVEVTLQNSTSLRFKIARLIDNALQPVTEDQRLGFARYMELIGYAGARIKVTTAVADLFKAHYRIFFDPTILNAAGQRLDGQDDAPVKTAINDYLKNKNLTDFNGELSLNTLDEIIASVSGVTDVFRQSSYSKFGNFNYEDTNTEGNVGLIIDFRTPESGYFELDALASQFQYISR